jgi:hypothetical protein
MKILLRASLLAVSAAMMAGCHGGEPASPAVVETVQASVVQSQQLQVPLNIHSTGTVHCAGDRDGFGAGCGPHSAGSGA